MQSPKPTNVKRFIGLCLIQSSTKSALRGIGDGVGPIHMEDPGFTFAGGGVRTYGYPVSRRTPNEE